MDDWLAKIKAANERLKAQEEESNRRFREKAARQNKPATPKAGQTVTPRTEANVNLSEYNRKRGSSSGGFTYEPRDTGGSEWPKNPVLGQIYVKDVGGGKSQRYVYDGPGEGWKQYGSKVSTGALELSGVRASYTHKGDRVETVADLATTRKTTKTPTSPPATKPPTTTTEQSVAEVKARRERQRQRYADTKAVERQAVGKKYIEGVTRLDRRIQYVTEKGRIANIKKYTVGDVYDPKKRIPLTGGHYVGRDGTIKQTSIARAQQFRAARTRRLRQENLPQEIKQRRQEAKHQRNLKKRRIADRVGRNLVRKKARASAKRIRERAFLSGIRGASGYGKKPLNMLLKGKRLLPGQKKLLEQLPHGKRYPAVGHRLSKPMPPPVSMRPLSGTIDLTSPYPMAEGRAFRPSYVSGQLATTTKTLKTDKFPEGGRGVYFRMNAEQVINNLSRHYPKQLLAANKRIAPQIGRKLLDIIEPYVPKDTGLMYTTATETSGRTLSGDINLSSLGAMSGGSFGVAISYNTPYAEMVYYDTTKAHGEAYNIKHNTNIKGKKETARWIEVAFENEWVKTQKLMQEYARKMVDSLKVVSRK